jgi:hypothetical protein
VTEVDPDPNEPVEGESMLGGRAAPAAGDPTKGGKRGEIGDAASVTSDEPEDGRGYPAGGGDVGEEPDAPPVFDPGPGA